MTSKAYFWLAMILAGVGVLSAFTVLGMFVGKLGEFGLLVPLVPILIGFWCGFKAEELEKKESM